MVDYLAQVNVSLTRGVERDVVSPHLTRSFLAKLIKQLRAFEHSNVDQGFARALVDTGHAHTKHHAQRQIGSYANPWFLQALAHAPLAPCVIFQVQPLYQAYDQKVYFGGFSCRLRSCAA